MLIRITNKCLMGCSHCMIESTPDGEHMSIETFKKALDLTLRIDPTLIFLSGGEPTDHPQFIEIAKLAKEYAKRTLSKKVLIGSNGLFLEDEVYTKELLSLGVDFQITNDPRYYPKQIKKRVHPALIYVDHINSVSPFGRALTNGIPYQGKGPLCFNLRSLCYNYGDIVSALRHLRSIVRMCTPSVNIDGSIVAGESSSCYKIGDVWSSDSDLTNNILSMKCGKCGLQNGLSGEAAEYWDKFENYKEVKCLRT